MRSVTGIIQCLNTDRRIPRLKSLIQAGSVGLFLSLILDIPADHGFAGIGHGADEIRI